MNQRYLLCGPISLVLLAACDAAAPSAEPAAPPSAAAVAVSAVKPDPSKCPKPEQPYDEQEFGAREHDLLVPNEFAAIAATDGDNLAVTTLDGTQICEEVSWMMTLGARARADQGSRFLVLDYEGYESFGTLVFDRSTGSEAVETGDLPHFSPSGRLMAALQQDEAAFGGLQGFAIWKVEDKGLKQLHFDDGDVGETAAFTEFADMRIERWRGEDCLDIEGWTENDLTASNGDRDTAKRTPLYAAEDNKWSIQRGRCPQ